MAKYTLDTRFARFEGGVYTLYPPGLPVDLSAEELDIFAPGVVRPYVPDSPSDVEVEKMTSKDKGKTLFVVGPAVNEDGKILSSEEVDATFKRGETVQREAKTEEEIEEIPDSDPKKAIFRTTLSRGKESKG